MQKRFNIGDPMQDSFIIYILSSIIVLLMAFIAIEIYLLINKRKNKERDKLVEETNRLREEVDKIKSFNK